MSAFFQRLLYAYRTLVDDTGNAMPTRGVLHVSGATLSDDPVNDATILTVAAAPYVPPVYTVHVQYTSNSDYSHVMYAFAPDMSGASLVDCVVLAHSGSYGVSWRISGSYIVDGGSVVELGTTGVERKEGVGSSSYLATLGGEGADLQLTIQPDTTAPVIWDAYITVYSQARP